MKKLISYTLICTDLAAAFQFAPPNSTPDCDTSLTGCHVLPQHPCILHQNKTGWPLRGEMATDFITGVTLWQNVYLQAGVKNITDEQYVNHLNAKKSGPGLQIPEAGRVFFVILPSGFNGG